MAIRDPMARPHLLIRMRGRRVADPIRTAGPGRHRTTSTNPAPTGGRQKETETMTPDALTVRPSKAELQVAHYRKLLIALAPVLLAGFVVLQDAATAGQPMRAVTIVTAILAVGQALGTYLPGNAVAKLISSGLFAVGSGVVAATTDGLTLATALMVMTQLLAWIGASSVQNGARPDIVLSEAAGTLRPMPE